MGTTEQAQVTRNRVSIYPQLLQDIAHTARDPAAHVAFSGSTHKLLNLLFIPKILGFFSPIA
jgi:hypothetical protein